MKNCKVIPEHITFPGNEDFGNWAWTFRDLDKARAKFAKLESEPVKINA